MNWQKLFLSLAFLGFATNLSAQARAPRFLVIGVIASANADKSVALLKNMDGGEAFAARVGQRVAHEVVLDSVTREYVFFKIRGSRESVRVGEQVETDRGSSPANLSLLSGEFGGFERRGNTVKLSASLRDHIVKQQLSQVLLQAAAVPYYVNGELIGFRLWEIDPGSVFDKAGFVNGDIVTSINGQRLTDVGMTVRTLYSLKEESKIDITFQRGGAEQSMQLLVQ